MAKNCALVTRESTERMDPAEKHKKDTIKANRDSPGVKRPPKCIEHATREGLLLAMLSVERLESLRYQASERSLALIVDNLLPVIIIIMDMIPRIGLTSFLFATVAITRLLTIFRNKKAPAQLGQRLKGSMQLSIQFGGISAALSILPQKRFCGLFDSLGLLDRPDQITTALLDTFAADNGLSR